MSFISLHTHSVGTSKLSSPRILPPRTPTPLRLDSGGLVCGDLLCVLHVEGYRKECRSILRDEASVYFNVTALHV